MQAVMLLVQPNLMVPGAEAKGLVAPIILRPVLMTCSRAGLVCMGGWPCSSGCGSICRAAAETSMPLPLVAAQGPRLGG
jgi:hypothetical protein